MKQSQSVLSCYAADLFGIASALYELGGLVVMHDASGCNSTYSTHDEPRWYDTPSMVYISGLNEIDTVQGNDSRLIDHIAEAAEETHPNFIAVGGSPLPNAIGTDFRALARLVERRTGIPTLGFRTDGIHSYLAGAGEAFLAIARRFVKDPAARSEVSDTGDSSVQSFNEKGIDDAALLDDGGMTGRSTMPIWGEGNGRLMSADFVDTGTCKEEKRHIKVNLIGATPLDFSVVGNVVEMKKILREHALELVSCWAMGSSFEEIEASARADVNCVISSTGFPAAKYLKEAYGIPYVIGIPIGASGIRRWIRQIEAAAGERVEEKNRERARTKAGKNAGEKSNPSLLTGLDAWKAGELSPDQAELLIIGEPVYLASMKAYLEAEHGLSKIRLLCPFPDAPKELTAQMNLVTVEGAIREECKKARYVLADPIYARLMPGEPEKFLPLPHEAFSGRFYRDQIPRFVGGGLSPTPLERLLQTL